MDDDFKVVARPKRRQKFSKSKLLQIQQTRLVSESKQDEDEDLTSSVEYICKTLRDYREEMKSTSFYKSFKELLLVKLHHGLKCDRHQSLFTNNGERDSNEEYIIDSTPDLKKTLFDPAKEESISNIYRQTSSTTIDLQALTIQESADDQEVITPKTDNAETASFLLSPSEMCLCRPHPQAVGCDTDHCKTLTNLELVIYGIGNFAECIIARYQLALMLALQNTLKLPGSRVLVFDPKLSAVEKSAIRELGFSLISHNEEGKHRGTDKQWTLFFMPHCGKALCNNLLWANWSAQQLSNIIIIGNSFSSLVERTPDRLLKRYYFYIWKISFFLIL
ncbi:SRR1-like protein [Acanthosepion pharaonis]|uniref:SRR1-like protein n=1 Tax=Acanthosepion pharaonis TaxID=158019 RepID=A0A812AN53_ACAPH|nr:SRR1-like protein [Sepia pharaonis]